MQHPLELYEPPVLIEDYFKHLIESASGFGTFEIFDNDKLLFIRTLPESQNPFDKKDITEFIISYDQGEVLGQGTFSEVRKVEYRGKTYALKKTDSKGLEERENLTEVNKSDISIIQPSKIVALTFASIDAILAVQRDIYDRQYNQKEYLKRLANSRKSDISEFQDLFLPQNTDIPWKLAEYFGFFFDGSNLYEIIEYVDGLTVKDIRLSTSSALENPLLNGYDNDQLKAIRLDLHEAFITLKEQVEKIRIVLPQKDQALSDVERDNVFVTAIRYDEVAKKYIFDFVCIDLIPRISLITKTRTTFDRNTNNKNFKDIGNS